MRAVIVLSLAVAGCASTDPAPPASPPSPSTPSTAVDSSASPLATAEECSATTASARPEGWIDTGKVTVLFEDGRPTIVDILDASGKSRLPAQIMCNSVEAWRKNIRQAICVAGGVLGLIPEMTSSYEIVTFVVLRPPVLPAKRDAVQTR